MRKIFIVIVLAVSLCSCDDIFEKDISKENLGVIAPADSVTVVAGDINFLWEEVEGASAYRIVIVSPSFENAGIVVGDEILKNDTVTRHRNFKCNLAPGNYQWSIKAMNSGYSTVSRILTLFVEEPEAGPAPANVI